MAGEDAVYDAAFKRAGIVRVDTIQDLFDCAELMAKQPRPRGSRLAIVTNGGGPGVMAADTLARFGLEPASLSPETIRGHLMQETRAWNLLLGYRNRPPADVELLEEMIIRLSQLLIDLPHIAELDMNPVLIKDGLPLAVDARILVSAPLKPSPMHLATSPYPVEDEIHLTTEEGARLFVRPVRPEDAPLFRDLFEVLSPTTIYQRFFRYVKELNPEMLARFCKVDYDREIALIALDDNPDADRVLGVSRIMGDPDGREGEFAVLVGDPWHGKGIGSTLLERCLSIAERRGFQTVRGIVLTENQSMLALGKKLGFEVHKHPETGGYELVIHFGPSGDLPPR
jgi:acetyltransferase